jgi:hypothetical protein
LRIIKKTSGDEYPESYEKYFSVIRGRVDAALERPSDSIREYTEIKQIDYEAITHFNDPKYESNKKHF